jgi:UDP-N-acetylglucosamine:LPS N-acetylglucosamine transferase
VTSGAAANVVQPTRRALVVYSRVGGGHFSAARALAYELESSEHCAVSMVDAYVECGRFPVTQFPATYARLARHHPRLWSTIYAASSKGFDPKLALGPFLRTGFRRVLEERQPDVVVSVLPAINGLLVEAAIRIGARVEVVLTDLHSVHRFWAARGVHHYTAPTESARADCIRFGAPPAAVDVVGVPIRREFGLPAGANCSRALAEIGLDPGRFTVLVMVGAEGSPRAFQNIASLARATRDIQVLVVCGRNHELRRDVQRLTATVPLRAVGFVDNVADLMQAADVVVTKAGGLTLAEAFACRAPVVVHDVLPGQETGNLEYVLECRAALYARDSDSLARIVSDLCANPALRAELAKRGAQLARPDAARTIARNITSRLHAQA